MSIMLADLDRWDPDAIHAVFQAATGRAHSARTAADNLDRIIQTAPWEGEAYEAAVAASGKITSDLNRHAEAAQAVARAAGVAEAEVRAVKAGWRDIQDRADAWGITIDTADNSISYPIPADPDDTAEMERRAQLIGARLQDLLERAEDADQALAWAISGAVGEQTPAEIDRLLQDGAAEQLDAEQGTRDGRALLDGALDADQRERLLAATTLTPEEHAALGSGGLVLPPERLAYLVNLSRSLGDKTPTEITAIMDKLGADGARIPDVLQLASNPHISTGVAEKGKPGGTDHMPARGGKFALPDGIQTVLDGPALTQPTTPGIPDPGETSGRPVGMGPLRPAPGLNDLADIIQRGNPDLQAGTALDSGLFTKGQEMLAQANQWPIEQLPGPGVSPLDDGPRWYHENVDPTLQNMFNAVNKDQTVIHEALVGPPVTGEFGEQKLLTPQGKEFLDHLTRHQWQDDGLAAGGLFDWVGETAANDVNNRAANLAHALAEFTSAHSDQLLNLEGTPSQSLGEVNPELTRDLARVFAPYFDDMVGNNVGGNNGLFPPLDPETGGDTIDVGNTRRLMSVLFSDHPPLDHPGGADAPRTASEILFDSSKAYAEKSFELAAFSAADSEDPDKNSAMRFAGKLQAALDLGSYDAARDTIDDDFQAEHRSWELRSMLFDLATYAGKQLPGGAAIADAASIGKETLIGPEPVKGQAPSTTLPDTFPIERYMAQTLANAGIGDLSNLRQYLRDGVLVPPLQDGEGRYVSYQDAISDYLDDIGSGAIDTLINRYWRTYTTTVVGRQ